MIDFITAIVNWILSLFGGSVGPSPIKIKGRCYMPLFYPEANGPSATWDYLSKSDAARTRLRDYIKANAGDLTPAISFCLTPHNINGGTIGDNMVTTDALVDVISSRCDELVQDGIAVFACLYVDDAAPRWMEISRHVPVWNMVHAKVKDYLTGVILAIETNEKASNKGHIENCINVMRSCFPGLDYYGTHLQWKSGGAYSWNGGNAPGNADIILMETSNDPHRDVSADFVLGEYNAAQNANRNVKIVVHEYNLNFTGARAATVERLKNSDAWGYG